MDTELDPCIRQLWSKWPIEGEKETRRRGRGWWGRGVLDHITAKDWRKNIFRTDKKLARPIQQEKQVRSIEPELSFRCQNISPTAPLPGVSSYHYHMWTVLRYISMTSGLPPSGTADLAGRQDNLGVELLVCRKLDDVATWWWLTTCALNNDLMGSRGMAASYKGL